MKNKFTFLLLLLTMISSSILATRPELPDDLPENFRVFEYQGVRYGIFFTRESFKDPYVGTASVVAKSGGKYTGDITIPGSFKYVKAGDEYDGSTCYLGAISEKTFYNCTDLTSVTIPSSVTSIGNSAFEGCSKLASVKFNLVGGGSIATFLLKSIGNRAFYNCTALTSLTIPSSVTSIGESAFYNCTALTSVNIPNSLETIGNSAFEGCSKLASVSIPNSVTSIGERAFSYCETLTSVTIPNSVTRIGDSTFEGCYKLVSVIIPSSVTSIGVEAFMDCYALTSVTIPNSVKSIDIGAFYSCTALTSVTIGKAVTSIGESAFYGCSALTSVTIPNSVTSIGDRAFNDCSKLNAIKSLILRIDKVTMGKDPFKGVPNTCKLSVPAGTTNAYKAQNAWKVFTQITEFGVLLNKKQLTFEAIGNKEQLNATVLPATALDKTVTWTSSNSAVATVSTTGEVEAISAGKANIVVTTNDGGYTDTCKVEVRVTFKVDKLYFNITSSSPNKMEVEVCPENRISPFYQEQNMPKGKIDIPSSVDYDGNSYNVTSIGGNAFESCTALTSVTIPNSVTNIGNYAFSYSEALTSVTIPNSVTSIGTGAFEGCSALTSVTIPNSVTTIEGEAFMNCHALKSVTIPNSVTSIEYGVFYGCSALTSVTIPNSVTSIGEDAFLGCSALTSVTIPNSVTSIGGGVFSYCML